jgi:hypothetical protein
MRLLVLGFLAVATTAAAQDTKTKQATKAPAPQTKQQDTKAAATKTVAPDTKAPDTKAAAGAAARRPGLAIAPETTSQVRVPVIYREAFDYDAGGRRDPFFSLLGTSELRPAIGDLKLSVVLYHPTRPIAVMRDAGTNTRYTVTVGTTLGRMRVIMIKPRVVIFSIEEFGLNRQDSLVLADTSKARVR